LPDVEPLLKNGKLIKFFPEWTNQLFPLYVYYPSRHFVPAKLRVFLDFLVSSLEAERPLPTGHGCREAARDNSPGS
jgi:DNA-binding transcriptional LysR family regulator